MLKLFVRSVRVAVLSALVLPFAVAVVPLRFCTLAAQSGPSSSMLTGTVHDPRGAALPGAAIVLRNDATGAVQKLVSDGQGRFSTATLVSGKYTIEVTANGFAPSKTTGVQVAYTQPLDVPITLALGNVSEQVTVEATASGSIASALAPMDALLDATSARTEITQAFISNFTSPVADFGEAVEMAPGTFTTNGNGVGLGQSSTYFRGFPDGDYDIDFDGIPFYDTNTPTHHSWAFFPSQFLGGIDFDRSPGTASTIGPTPFGGSIHLLSKDISPLQNVRGQFSYGSYNTFLYDGEYDSGSFGHGHKLSLQLDVHHLQSDGFQTFNNQTRNAGEIKMQYKFSDRTVLTGFSGVIWLDANTPNFKATRCQMYGAVGVATCTGSAAFFANQGTNFLLTDNSDPANYLDNQYNYYHVPTDFEYVGLHMERGHGMQVDVKPYTYNYDNSEKYTNATPITEATTIAGSKTYNGIAIAPCNVAVVSKSISALPCGVDKYNSYRKYGETATVSQISRFGILRAGLWYEWADTNRHQFPSDPLNNWADQTLPNFSEQFWNNIFEPFVEYDFHATKKLSITPGVKYSHQSISTKQLADNGKTIGNLCNTLVTPSVCVPSVSNFGAYGAWLPSIDANYRISNKWSAYGQLSTGSIVPPSSVYDFNQTISKTNPTPGLGVAPKQQRSTTYQFGTVLKLKRVTFDADYYHVRFQNSYSALTDPVTGEQDNFLQPSSITKGFEAESNVYFGHGLSAYLNASVGRATYTGNFTVYSGATATSNPLVIAVPSGLWVANTPSDTETEGITYQRKAWDLGIFNKRVGTLYQDDGAYHNQATINPFSLTNAFLNYTIRSGSRFDQTKIRLSFNNVFNESNQTSISLKNAATTQTFASNGLTYTDPFNTNGQAAISGADTIGTLPGRSVMLSVTFGLSPKR